jgi:hypothetical protein
LIILKYQIELSIENKNILKNIKFSNINTIDFKKEKNEYEHLFKDVSLIIDTVQLQYKEEDLQYLTNTLLRKNIIKCTTLQHARGLVRALQFYYLKNLELFPMNLKEEYSLSSNHKY